MLNRVHTSGLILSTGLVLGVVALPAQAVPTNLALGGTATASTELGLGFGNITPFFAAKAIDGNRAGNNNDVIFHTLFPDAAPPSYFQVDLGADKFLDRVQVFPRTNAGNQGSVENFRLDVHDTGNNLVFSKAYLVGTSTGVMPWGTNELRNVVGSRVRLTRLDALPQVPNFLTFAEFEVFGQDTKIAPNLALGGAITATDAGGFGTSNSDAIDGDIDGNYSRTDTTGVGSTHPIFHNNTRGGFWQVDLGSEQEIDYINLFSRTDYTGNSGSATLDILAADGVTVVHTEQVSFFGTDLGGQRYDQVFDLSKVNGRYVRVTNNLTGGNNFLTFAELEVFVALPEPAMASLTALSLALLGLRRVRR